MFSFKNAISVYEDFSELKEDMLQISFQNGILLDFGYYNGIYKILVIKAYDWENPLKVLTINSDTTNIEHLIQSVINEIETDSIDIPVIGTTIQGREALKVEEG